MKTSQAGLDLIKRFEGLRLEAYTCPAGVLTIGYGHTGPDVFAGLMLTADWAEDILRKDLAAFERGVMMYLDGAPTTQNQFDAMVSLAFNIGLGGFMRSSVLRHHKAGNRLRAAASFLMWVRAGGRVMKGLINRRNAERKLYLTP